MAVIHKIPVDEFFNRNYPYFRYIDDLIEHMISNGYHVIKIRSLIPNYMEEKTAKIEWMREQGINESDGTLKFNYFMFTHAEDALLFKLTWG